MILLKQKYFSQLCFCKPRGLCSFANLIMAQSLKRHYNSLSNYSIARSSEQSRKRLWLLLFVGIFVFSQHVTFALTQSHQGSATTNEFILNEISPNARIQISSSSAVYVVNVEPPGASGDLKAEWKVSLDLLALQLCEPAEKYGGDKLKVVYSDPTSIKSHTWTSNASYASLNDIKASAEELRQLENIQANQIVMIPEGRWILSRADLVATLYQDPLENGTCPDDTFTCSCASTAKHARCIPKTLVCNGHLNCGFRCRDDESESFCAAGVSSPPYLPTTSCAAPETSTTTTSTSVKPSLGNGVNTNAPTAARVIIPALIGTLLLLLH